MNTLYDIRVSKTVDYDGTVLEERYATTTDESGVEWCVDEKGEMEFPIGNKSADIDDVVAVNVSFEEMKKYLEQN